MVKWYSGYAVLVVVYIWIIQQISEIRCYDDLFGGPVSDLGKSGLGGVDLLGELLAKKEEESEEPITIPEPEYYYSPVTLVATKKNRTAQSSEFVLEDMKQKKIFQKTKRGENIVRVLEDLSYDDDYADDENVTMYKEVFSHEKTTLTQAPVTKAVQVKGKRKTTKGSEKTEALDEETVNLATENTVSSMYDDEESSNTDSGPKQITSHEVPYEYLIDVLSNNQTVFRRIYPTPRTVQMDTRIGKELNEHKFCNLSKADEKSSNKTKRRRIRTTTEYKALKTEKSRYKFHRLEKKYGHLIIGKLPNTTQEKERDCLEKEILHIFTVENMKGYLTELIHNYKHHRSYFNDVVNLVNNVSIFDIETDDIGDKKHKHFTILSNTINHLNLKSNDTDVNNLLEGEIHSSNLSETESATHVFTPSKVTIRHALQNGDGNLFLNRHLNEKFDLAALNNLFNDEKRIITDYDRDKYDRINVNLKHILHCLKINLNMHKYNYINDTNVKDLMEIIWKNRIKYDESDYASEYEDLYELCKTLDYYEVSSQYEEEYQYHLNEHSGIEEKEPYSRNPETQNVIKEALRNISQIRKERHEFDRGILEGQVKNRCHYCGKNYSTSQEMRYMKHVHKHILEELDGSNYDIQGVYVKDQGCWDKAFPYMTKATVSTLPTIDIFPYYAELGSRELDHRFQYENYTTRDLHQLAEDKRKKDRKKEMLDRNFEEKHKRAERDKDIEDMRKFIRNRDFVTFSDESLPGVVKRYVNRFANHSRLLLNRTGKNRFFPELHDDKLPKKLDEEPNILGQFEQEKEQQDEYRINELKQAAHELLKRKDWRSQLNMHPLMTTTDVDVEKREKQMKQMKKVQRKRYQQKLLKDKKQREMQKMWQQDNLNADKWVFKTNVWTTLVPQ